MVYNRVVIPKGYTYRVELADGSRVTLNAGSELRYPVEFRDSLREVEFRGEGYFEVAKDAAPFVVRAGDGRPTDMSRVLYVELVSPGGDVVKKRTLRIDTLGQACGDIGLDSIYGSGFYEVRAYTRYMTNWGSAAAFSRVFPIFRAPSAAGDYAPVMDERDYRHRLPDSREADTLKRGRLNVSFYPEGGRMVAGLESRVAFWKSG